MDWLVLSAIFSNNSAISWSSHLQQGMPSNEKSNQYVIRHVWRYQRIIKSVNLKDRQYKDKNKMAN